MIRTAAAAIPIPVRQNAYAQLPALLLVANCNASTRVAMGTERSVPMMNVFGRWPRQSPVIRVSRLPDTRTADVVAKAGMATGSLFTYVGSKETFFHLGSRYGV